MASDTAKAAAIAATATIAAAIIGLVGIFLQRQPAAAPAQDTHLATSMRQNPVGQTAPPALFHDDFSGANLRADWQPVSGKWYVQDGVLNGVGQATPQRDWAVITLDEDLPSSCTVSFRTRIVTGELSELMFHVAHNRYVRVYLYTIDQALMFGDGTFLEQNRPGEVGLSDNLSNLGGGVTLAQHGYPVLPETWYRIKVTFDRSVYTVSVGGQQLIQYRDPEKRLSRDGTIGFISNGHMQFDDVHIIRQ